MITTFILQILYGLLSGILSIFPDASLYPFPSDIQTILTYISYQISQWTFVLPISTLMTIIVYVFLIEFTLWLFHAAIWIYRHIRGN